MNRNAKIALGCGGAGCLGVIVVVVACVILAAAGYISLPGYSSNYNYNYNSNYNRNSNYNLNRNTNDNTNSSTSSSSLTDDDKHKLFQAAGITRDSALILRVLRHIGFPNGTGAGYEQFVKDHMGWAIKNLEFIQSVDTPEKGRAYVEANLDD